MSTNHSTARASLLDLPAPAKINRFLRVIGQRADGYHQLETLFQFLEFADTLRFESASSPCIRRIDRHDFDLPEDDLIIRAARLLQAECVEASARGVVITLHKKIPPGSGLGGGSSNAATTLLALNHLWQLGLSRTRIKELGQQLGADVPVFIGGRAALASGIGEVLKPCAPVEQWLCVCLPSVQVSTAEVFSHPHLARTHPAVSSDDSDKTGNDLEPITTLLHPEVAAALAHLRRYGDAQMSGSGAAVYAGFETRAQAEQAVAQLPDNLPGFVSRARNRHPLVDFPR